MLNGTNITKKQILINKYGNKIKLLSLITHIISNKDTSFLKWQFNFSRFKQLKVDNNS